MDKNNCMQPTLWGDCSDANFKVNPVFMPNYISEETRHYIRPECLRQCCCDGSMAFENKSKGETTERIRYKDENETVEIVFIQEEE